MNSLIKGLRSLSVRSSVLTQMNQLLPVASPLIVEQQRQKGSALQRIKGAPRPPLPFKIQPRPHDYNFIPILPKVRSRFHL
jgi:hypothetical protein